MIEKHRLQYKLQYWDPRNKLLSIKWAKDRKDYIAGDCRVRAIQESTDVDEHNKIHSQKQNYSKLMTLDEARRYIEENSQMLDEVHDCVGLTLEDVCKVINFSMPIKIRNIKER